MIEVVENILDILLEVINGICMDLGFFWLNIGGGVVLIIVSWDGLVDGSLEVVIGFNLIENLLSGIYMIVIEDVNGCKEIIVREVENDELDLVFDVLVLFGVCEGIGDFVFFISGGGLMYKIEWDGFIDGFVIISDNFYVIDEILSGDYIIILIDVNGCKDVE